MTRLYVALSAVVVAVGVWAFLLHRPTVTSPTHVVAVYVDGINHQDYRQTCSVIHAPIAFPSMSRCESYFAFNTAMAGPSVFGVIPHSAKVWWDTYRGRRIHLAVVKYANLTSPYVLTAHLRWIKGQWKIVGVSA